MRLLLDTHIWIWALAAPDELDERMFAALADRDNELWLSPISVWEFLTLVRRDRLSVTGDPYQWLEEAGRHAPLKEAPLARDIVIDSQRLDMPHWDPADRFIAATARHLDLTLATQDRKLLDAEELTTP